MEKSPIHNSGHIVNVPEDWKIFNAMLEKYEDVKAAMVKSGDIGEDRDIIKSIAMNGQSEWFLGIYTKLTETERCSAYAFNKYPPLNDVIKRTPEDVVRLEEIDRQKSNIFWNK